MSESMELDVVAIFFLCLLSPGQFLFEFILAFLHLIFDKSFVLFSIFFSWIELNNMLRGIALYSHDGLS